MRWLDDLLGSMDECDQRQREAHRRWLDTPEGQRRSAEWQWEESRYGDR